VSTLTEIAVPRRGSRRRTLVLDGEPWRDAPSDVVSEAHLKPGDEFDAVELSGRLAEIEPLCARDRAVRLLTYRDRSTGELADRLAEDGYLPETVTAVIERLTSVGLLDDERFARSFARSLTLVRHLGRSRASRELAARGIDPLLAARPGATRDKVAARLARRGYSPRVALSAARDATSEIDSACEAGEWNDSGPDDEEDGRDGL
jgi:SOS response regulatory protein OraA/RecX